MRSIAVRLCALAFLALTGCAALFEREDALPPQVALTDFRLVAAALLEQEFELELRIANPNDFDLALSGLRYRLIINGRDLFEGQSGEYLTVPRLGEVGTRVRARTSTFRIVEQALALSQARVLSYTLEGEVIRAGFGRALPFARSDELRLTPDPRI